MYLIFFFYIKLENIIYELNQPLLTNANRIRMII